MKNIACQLEESVEAEVSPSFAWSWRTDIKNWDDPPAQFQLDGTFASGSWGATLLPGQEPLRWHIRDVQPGTSFVIDMPLDRAVLSFQWLFDAVSDRRTRITQRVVLSGDNAAAYANHVQVSFGATLAAGMKRIADAMARAARSTEGGGDE
jgi:Polyketide cyclase / dehydrase and lipid transport